MKRAMMAAGMAVLMAGTGIARAQDAVDRLDIKAHAAFDAQDFDNAIKYWGEVVKIDPADATAWFNQAMAYVGKGDRDDAIAKLGEAIRAEPTDAESYQFRAELYCNKRDEAVANGGTGKEEGDKAIEDYGEVIKLRPVAASYIYRAGAYRNMQQYDKAIADSNEVIRLEPKTALGYQLRAGIYAIQEDWDKAIADYTQMLALEPNAEFAYRIRGEAYLIKGDWDKAIADAGDAIKINPADYDAIALRGNAYSAKGMYDKAIADFDQLMADNPDFAEGYNAEAWLLATCPKAEIRNGTKALELAQKACELSQWKDGGFIDTLAAAEAEAGKWDDAVKHQKQALETGKSMKEDERQIKDYASRIPMYEQKQAFRDVKK